MPQVEAVAILATAPSHHDLQRLAAQVVGQADPAAGQAGQLVMLAVAWLSMG